MKLKLYNHLYVSCSIFFLLLLAGCKGPETTVVRQAPTPAAPDTTSEEQAPQTAAAEADFRQLVIGENNPIPTLDPLFAETSSTMRALQMVYEGLVRFDQNGTITAGLAGNWEVSPDSLTYRFTLRNNLYYHDSDAFSNGIGRRVVARDVKFAFERMARLTVPDDAARLFMDIEGFEPYYREQHQQYLPSQRVVQGVGGIQVPNDSTVVFELSQKDPHFLQKLASPYAVIYPREAITDNNPMRFKAVGAGPFTLSQQQGDSLYVFSKFDEYYRPEEPLVNRVDVQVKKREADLFRSFAGGDIHLLPELSVRIMEGVLDENRNLTPNYRNQYTLAKPGGATTYRLKLNTSADLNQQDAAAAAALFDSTDSFNGLPADFFDFKSFSYNPAESDTGNGKRISAGDTLNITNSKDPFERALILKLRDKLEDRGATLQVYDIYTPTRNTGLYISSHLPFYSNHQFGTDSSVLIEFSVPHLGLYRTEVPEVPFNRWPWWLDLRNTTINSGDNQNP